MEKNSGESGKDKCCFFQKQEKNCKLYRSRSRAKSKELKKTINEAQISQEDHFPKYFLSELNYSLESNQNNYALKKSQATDKCGQAQYFQEIFPCEDVSFEIDAEENKKVFKKKSCEILRNSYEKSENLAEKFDQLQILNKSSPSNESFYKKMDSLKI